MELSAEELKDKLNTDEKFILDLYASWCEPCKTLTPILERVEKQLRDNSSEVKVYKFNIDNDMELVKTLGVRAVPTIKFYSGGQNIKTNVGVMSEQVLLSEASTL